ncbi:AraC family transcriptional regulator [Pseudomaricurvus alkylphenolicus]|uniref:AraC family transcriptional regulator n=1 Tax=Pseudomaricurvus alkylphenolicus TaxID=1306991 RepID=UPI001423ECDF|nr:AraC family transcriptional regulator [Pseudomaricurvus alkylphenolicus]NIB42452.1 AraC family transcriptional regulator [Pseudomaricurvus alkylphenolicus]
MEKTQQLSISARMTDHSLAGARRAGLDLDRLFRKCGIPKEALKQPGVRIPLDRAIKLQNHCAALMQDEINGLFEKPAYIGTLRLMALCVVHTRTLGRALQRCAEFYNLPQNSLRYHFVVNDNQAEFILERIPGHRILDNYALSSAMTVIHRFVGWLCNERIILNQVNVDFPAPDYQEEFKYMYYGAPVFFNQEHYSIRFDASYLARKIVQSEASVESYVRRAPLDIYLSLDAGGAVTLQVRELVREAFSKQSEPPSLEHIAADMGFHLQTLRRRLKDEGTSFQTIKAQVRRDIAIHHLGHLDSSIEEIAAFTGYTEPSAFIRAFKAWTGFTPLQFRKGLEAA